MLDGYKVISVVPAGRKRYLEILLPYLKRSQGVLDECHLWRNTDAQDDIEYIRNISMRDRFFQVIDPDWPVDGSWSIHPFFRRCIDRDTVYIRTDDDVCYLGNDALEQLVRFRLSHEHPFLVYGNVVNNAVCSHIHQRFGLIPFDEGCCAYHCMDPIGWDRPAFAELAHESFFRHMAAGNLDGYKFPEWHLWCYARVSINVICWLGSTFALFDGQVGRDEEEWLACSQPRALSSPNTICGTALFSHFAFGPQRPHLEANTTLLQRYRDLSFKLAGRV